MPVVEPTAPTAPVSADPPSPSASSDPAALDAPSPQIGAKPDGLPDKYWDPQAGLRTKEIGETLAALDAENTRTSEIFKDFPKDAKEAGKFYTLPESLLPEGVKLPEGLQFEPNAQLLEAALPIFHKHKASPELFQDAVRAFNAFELENYQKATKEFAEDAKKLGAKGAERRKAVADGLKAMVGERAGFIDPEAISSQAVEFFEAVLEKFTNQSNVVPLHSKRDEQQEAPPPDHATRMFGNTMRAS